MLLLKYRKEVNIVKKNKSSNYVLTLQLKTEKHQEDILNKRLEIARNISNTLTGKVLKRYNLLLESKEYRKIKKQLNHINKNYHNTDSKKSKKLYDKERKILYKQLEELYLKYDLSQYSLYNDVKPMYKHFKDNINSLESQAIADRVWSKFDKLLHGNGNKVTFSRYNEYNSIENKWNKSGMKYNIDTNCVVWNKLNIPVIIKPNDTYAQKAIQNKVKYCRIVRKIIRGKYKFYVQLIIEGIPPIKINQNGELNRNIGLGDVGIDIGTQTIAYSSKYEVKLLELCPEVEDIQKVKTKLQRKLDRQRRANNPNNYNSDGTIKRGIKLKWVISKKYIKTQNKLKELQRKQASIRKQSHEKLANHILSLGNRIFVETMNFKGLQKRSKEITINDKTGKYNKKKRFGKSLANKAPSMLIEILNRKLKYEGLEILKINTQKVKASQYNHFTNEYNKKELKDRWNKDIEIQRDCYSAFLIMNVNDDLETINRDKCFDTYNNFKMLHDKEIERLKELKLQDIKMISSMGI